jgi:predicted adenylyl cyclase CyaB
LASLMPQNLEIKCRYPSAAKARERAKALGASARGILRQTDTYFKVDSGRLKLREINGKQFELIYYRRPDSKSTRYSDYSIISLPEARSAKSLFRSHFGVTVVVRKKRTLFLYKNARIHIDTVAGLGTFVEFEVVVTKGKRQAQELMNVLLQQFGIVPSMLIGGSYSDMIR